jgi:hypothetical protein
MEQQRGQLVAVAAVIAFATVILVLVLVFAWL